MKVTTSIHRFFLAMVTLACFAIVSTSANAAPKIPNEFIAVLTVNECTLKKFEKAYLLTLKGVYPRAILLVSRPVAVGKYLSSTYFLKGWLKHSPNDESHHGIMKILIKKDDQTFQPISLILHDIKQQDNGDWALYVSIDTNPNNTLPSVITKASLYFNYANYKPGYKVLKLDTPSYFKTRTPPKSPKKVKVPSVTEVIPSMKPVLKPSMTTPSPLIHHPTSPKLLMKYHVKPYGDTPSVKSVIKPSGSISTPLIYHPSSPELLLKYHD